MSEYTPTTDVVRSLYSGESTDGKESNKEFDRWLAAYKAKTIARTEERIIKLLEEESRNCEKAGLWANGPELRQQLQDLHLGLNAAIALIKGEQK